MLDRSTPLLSSFSRSERVCALSAAGLIVTTFLPWYSSGTVSTTAFGTGVLGVLVFLAAAGCWLGLLIKHKVIEARTINPVDLIFSSTIAAPALLLLQLIVGGAHTHIPSAGLVLAIPAAALLVWGGMRVHQRQALRHSTRTNHS